MQFQVSTIKTPLKVECFWEHKDGLRLRLLEGINYYRAGEPTDGELLDDMVEGKSGICLKNRKEIFIPAGYVSDGATIPKIFWWLLSPFENYLKCCILHDYLCDLFALGLIHRKTCDDIFLESMAAIGIKKSTRYILYFFVRAYALARYNSLSIKLFGKPKIEWYNQQFFSENNDGFKKNIKGI
ncbi:DUF1353 domain-containing protein [Helicobacter sp. 11S02596-1]|uniref:DUF1353 domain-containing protein n=1 Tax=Helicobacter sp. 11S02596-1 TaxID=1476194 RepID=UPI000BA74A2C|nr:DUF1353 domain-containing protein [Helicobacter sp. 11S02596-1]PAF41366.1 hypothetical protein BJI48_08730 [Helicobacter sp. 11S02596-1]